MRLFSLSAIALMLALCASVAAQQTLLVQHDDKYDPCSRFKMRILIPANVDDHILPSKTFAGGIDAGMVWNPCTTDRLQVALFVPAPAPHGAIPLVPNSFSLLESLTTENKYVKSDELLFKFNRRRP